MQQNLTHVYLTAAVSAVNKTPSKQTALQLGLQTKLPYFKVFTPQLVSLPELYQLINQQITQILQQTGWQTDEMCQIPIFLGSTGYVIADCEARLVQQQPLPTEYSMAVIGEYLRNKYQTDVFSLATSCTSSAQGVNYAYKMLKSGNYAKAIVIGFELFNHLTFEHFHAMRLLADTENYLPFIEPRGIVLGEGLACLALSCEPHTAFECELLAVTALTDNDNLTNNSESALQTLLLQTCRNAGLEPSQIQGIKVHGVGGNSDETEVRLLLALFPQAQWILAKPYMGHTLGASGATETTFLLDCLNAGKVPDLPQNVDNLPLAHGKILKNGYYLSYFLGFGGSNAAWIMRFNHNG